MVALSKGIDGLNPVSEERIKRACESILASELFVRSPRMSRLLSFIVDKALTHAVRDLSEYSIGIDVFDRNPSTYSTGDDPIVRVQMGRLREKLKNYYASLGDDTDIEIIIALGTYTPIFKRKTSIFKHRTPRSLFAISLFNGNCFHKESMSFSHGLYGELAHHMYKFFGSIQVENSRLESAAKKNEIPKFPNIEHVNAEFRLEGDVHVDSEIARTTVRLIKIETSCVVWSEQFTCFFSLDIKNLEKLALSICTSLQKFQPRKNEHSPLPFLYVASDC